MRAAVHRLEHAEAGGNVVARLRLAGADIDDIGIRRRHRDRADRGRRPVLEQGLPSAAGVIASPNAAAGGAEIERVGLGHNTFHCGRPARAEWAQLTPVKIAVEPVIGGVCASARFAPKSKSAAQPMSLSRIFPGLDPDFRRDANVSERGVNLYPKRARRQQIERLASELAR